MLPSHGSGALKTAALSLFVAAVVVGGVRGETNTLGAFSLDSFDATLNPTLCEMSFSNVNLTAEIDVSSMNMTAAPVLKSLNFTVFFTVAGHNYQVMHMAGLASASSGVLQSPNTAKVQATVGALPSTTLDRVGVNTLGVAVINTTGITLPVAGVASVDVTDAAGTSAVNLAVSPSVSFPGMDWGPAGHNPTHFTAFNAMQDLDSDTLVYTVTVTIPNPSPSVGLVISSMCAPLVMGGRPISTMAACMRAGSVTVPAGQSADVQLQGGITVPNSASDDGAAFLASVFAGPQLTLNFEGTTSVESSPCQAISTAILPEVAQTKPLVKPLIAEVYVLTGPMLMGSPVGGLGFTLQNPLGADVAVNITSLQVFDNSSNPLFALADTQAPMLIVPAYGTASTTRDLNATYSYVVPPTQSSEAATQQLLQTMEATRLPVVYSAEVRLFNKGAAVTIPESQTVVTTVKPRVTPAGGCTTSTQCPGSFCVPGTGVCAKDPTTGCNQTSVPCGIGGVVVPANGSTPASPKCTCECVAPCYSGDTCSTVDTSLPSCTVKNADAYANALGNGCGSLGASLGHHHHRVSGWWTLNVGFGWRAPYTPGLSSGPAIDISVPKSIRSYGHHWIPDPVKFQTVADPAVTYTAKGFDSAAAFATDVKEAATAVQSGVTPWSQTKPNAMDIKTFATSLQGNVAPTIVTQSLTTVKASLDLATAKPSMCLEKELQWIESLLQNGSSDVADAAVQRFATQNGMFLVTDADLGGTAQLTYKPPYHLRGNPPPGATTLSVADMQSSAVAQFASDVKASPPDGISVNPTWAAATPPASQSSLRCSGGATGNCLVDNAQWQHDVKRPGSEAVVAFRVQKWDVLVPVPKTASALAALAQAQFEAADGVANCGTCVDSDGQCASSAVACTCRTSHASPYSGAGAYGRNCATCSPSTGDGFWWMPAESDPKRVCINSMSYSGSGCGSCPFGSGLQGAVETEGGEDGGPAAPFMQDTSEMQLKPLERGDAREGQAEGAESTGNLRGIHCHHDKQHCSVPSYDCFAQVSVASQCHHHNHGWYHCGSSGDDGWHMTYKVTKGCKP